MRYIVVIILFEKLFVKKKKMDVGTDEGMRYNFV